MARTGHHGHVTADPAAPGPRLLALVRHAKAEPGEDRSDHDRELTRRGRSAATDAGRWLARLMPAPELVWCSSAVRARQTWAAMSGSLRAGEVVTERALYLATGSDVVVKVGRAGLSSMVVVGHNPTMEEVLRALTGEHRGLRPGAVAVVDLDGDRLVELWEPDRNPR